MPEQETIILKVLAHVEQMFKDHETADARRWERFDHRLEELTNSIVSYMDKHADVMVAIPGGDVEGHRRYHEAVIQRLEDRADFWRKMRIELGKWGLIGFAGWLLYVVWTAVLHGPAK